MTFVTTRVGTRVQKVGWLAVFQRLDRSKAALGKLCAPMRGELSTAHDHSNICQSRPSIDFKLII